MQYLQSIFTVLATMLLPKAAAQCPSLQVEFDSQYCKGELVNFTNTSTGASSYFWDFCSGDNLNQQPTSERILNGENIGSPFDLKVISYQDEYYGFLANNANAELKRLDFGTSISNTPALVNVGVPSGATLSKAGGIDIENEGGNFYGLMTGFNSSRLYLLNYGSDPLSVPQATDVSGGLGLVLPSDVEILESDGSYYAFIVGNGSGVRPIIRLDYGNSLLNTPIRTEFNVGATDQLFKIDFVQDCDLWYAFVTSRGTDEVYRLNFGTDLSLDPAIDEITSGTGLTLNNPVGVSVSLDDSVYIHITSRNAFSYRLSLPSLSSNEVVGSELEVGNSNDFGIETFRAGSQWIAYRVSSSSRIDRLDFPSDCEAEPSFSTEAEPSVRFFTEGSKTINLFGTNSDGETNSLTQLLEISSDTVQEVTLSHLGACISSSVSFQSTISSGAISTYSWDFDGDNTEDSNEANPTFQYASTGSYTVRLDVSDETCSNFFEYNLTIYPEPSAPDFDFSASSLCSNSEITFENLTTESGLESVIEYLWDFNGEGTSTDKNPQFSFASSGTKRVDLLAIIPGCTTEVYSEQLIISEGPVADFTYTNNCFGEAIQFFDQSTGDAIVEWVWDFDDGETSTEQNSTHLFESMRAYNVSLTVVNDQGCTTVYAIDIEISNAPKAGFTTGETVENLPVQFTSSDLTKGDDSIDSWTWDFDGLGTSSDVNPSFIFPEPGSYSVQLLTESAQGCLYTIVNELIVSQAICPTLSYSLSAESCKGEEVQLINNSLNGESYFWDFCVGDNLNQQPTSERILIDENVGSPFDLKIIVYQSEYYGFIANNADNDLLRLDFGTSIANVPSLINVGPAFGAVTTEAGGIDIENETGNVYGLMTGFTSSRLYFLDYGSDPRSVPEATDIGSGLGLVQPSDVEILESGGNYYAFIVSNGAGMRPITRLNFGNSLLNTPVKTEFNVGTTDQLFKIDFVQDCDSWYAFVTSRGTGEVYRLNFGTDLSLDPVVDEITSGTGLTLDNPVGVSVSLDDSIYIHITSRNAFSYRLSLPSLSSTEIVGNELEVGNSNDFGIETFRVGSQWLAYRVSSSSRIDRLDFPSSCEAEPAFSTESEPSVRFFNEGTSRVLLRGTGPSNENAFLVKEVVVSSDSVPSIVIASIGNCTQSPVVFQGTIDSGSVDSYSWDFDGDNIEDSNLESPTFQYLATGTYTVRLDVNNGTCDNFVEQEITIYPEPSIPTFTALVLVCINSEIAFTNTTSEIGFDDVLTYAWDFNGEGSSTDRDPIFTFTTAGTKAIMLTSSIPGCEVTSEIFEIEVFAGPAAAFNPSSFGICEGEFIAFTDASTNGATSWAWNFGDGFTSTAQNPDHLFTTGGNYTISLTVTDALGCESTTSEEVSIAALPTVSFDFDVACTSADGIQFMDLSTVEGADIVSRKWFVDATEVDTEENPILGFESEGLVNIRLEVTSSNGCTSSYSEDIQILPSPEPDFAISIGCEGEATSLIDLTASADNPVGTWLWSVDGATYNTQNASHTFSGTGMFDVTLEVTGQNFCSETTTQTVEILELPEVGFSIDGDCSNEFIILNDTSTVFQDPVVSRNWLLDGAIVGNGSELLLEALPQSTYDLVLEVTTASGCVTSSSQDLLINSTPISSFELQRNFGVPGDQITFTNGSSGAVNYQWFFNGSPNGSESAEKIIIFPDAGSHEISLVSTNSLGCSDTISTEVLIAVPVVDLSIGQFEVVNTDNNGRIFIEIENNSNLPIEVTEAVIELENKFSVTEQVASLIGAGESRLVSLNTGIPLTTSELTYLCVTLNSQYSGYPDLTPVNNEKCLTIQPNAIVVEAPYPNPATTETRVKLVTPMEGSAVISLFNSSGKIEFSYTENVEAGLNNFFLNVKDLQAGIYFVRLQFNETISVQRVIKL